MSTPITTGNHPRAHVPMVNKWFGIGYDQYLQWKELFDQEKVSSGAREEDVLLNGFGNLMVKSQGSPVKYVGHQQGYIATYIHVAYALGFIVTYEELRDNLYPQVAKSRAQALGISRRLTKETVAADVYNNAFDSDFTGGDGVELISSSHVTDNGNQSNLISQDFSESAVEDMIIQIMGTKDNIGQTIKLMPKSLHIPRQLKFEACRVLNSTLQNDTANNATNAVKDLYDLKPYVNHFFDDEDAWFMRTTCPNGMKMFQRDGYNLKYDNDFPTKNALADTYDRYSFMWSDFRGISGSAGI